MEVRKLPPALSRREFSLNARQSHLLLLEAGTMELQHAGLALTDTQAIWQPWGREESVRIEAGSRMVMLSLTRAELSRIDANGIAGNLVAPLSNQTLHAPLSAKNWQRLSLLIEMVSEDAAAPIEDSSHRIDAASSLILTDFLRLFRERAKPKAVLLPVVERFMLLVAQHAHEHWSVQDYAQALGLTRFQLGTQVRRELGQTPLAIIQKHWLGQALVLLRQPHIRIAVIAYKLGFQDPAYFSRAFKQAVGQTPKEWRMGQMIPDGQNFAAWP